MNPQPQLQSNPQPITKSLLPKPSTHPTPNLQKYRKKLLAQVIIIFFICLIVILQRVFYLLIIQQENTLLATFQLNSQLVKTSDTQVQPDGIDNPFLVFFGSLSQFYIQFLFLTHFLATMYVSFDALLTTKILYITMLSIYLISVIQIFYEGAHPFWSDQRILSSSCLQSLNHPSLGLILMIFIPTYSYYAWLRKSNLKLETKTPMKHIIVGIVIIGLIVITQFLNYMIGIIYIINIGMSIVIAILILMITIAANSVIQQTIKKSTILKTQAKMYVFYWLLTICLLGAFVMVLFSGQDQFIDINWINNFINCTQYHTSNDKIYRYDQMVGPWFNFIQTSTLFAWIGAIFGISQAFRTMPFIEWSKGSIKNRLVRGIITNILILPSWFFIFYAQQTGSWIKNIGLNNFIVNALHFFLLYLWIFGHMPILILYRLFNLINMEDDDNLYIIVDKK